MAVHIVFFIITNPCSDICLRCVYISSSKSLRSQRLSGFASSRLNGSFGTMEALPGLDPDPKCKHYLEPSVSESSSFKNAFLV